MLEAFNITDRTFAATNGVSMEPGTFNSFMSYRLHKDAFISQPTKYELCVQCVFTSLACHNDSQVITVILTIFKVFAIYGFLSTLSQHSKRFL